MKMAPTATTFPHSNRVGPVDLDAGDESSRVAGDPDLIPMGVVVEEELGDDVLDVIGVVITVGADHVGAGDYKQTPTSSFGV